jgi:hypothetical protein
LVTDRQTQDETDEEKDRANHDCRAGKGIEGASCLRAEADDRNADYQQAGRVELQPVLYGTQGGL